MFQQKIQPITPSDETHFLVGEQGTVWVQPAIGEPVILAANTDQQRADVADFIWGLLNMRLVPYGMGLDHLQKVAMFGGDRLHSSRWVHHSEAPAPVVEEGEPQPIPALIIVAGTGKNRYEEIAIVTVTAIAAYGTPTTDEERHTIINAIVKHSGCSIDTAKRHLTRYLSGQTADPRGGKRAGSGRPKMKDEL